MFATLFRWLGLGKPPATVPASRGLSSPSDLDMDEYVRQGTANIDNIIKRMAAPDFSTPAKCRARQVRGGWQIVMTEANGRRSVSAHLRNGNYARSRAKQINAMIQQRESAS